MTVSGFARAGAWLTVSGTDFRIIHWTLLRRGQFLPDAKKVAVSGGLGYFLIFK